MADTASGWGRLLIAFYAILALSATARSVLQLATKFSEAPAAYLLSAFAAAVYVVATYGLAVRTPTATKIAWVAVAIEFVGVYCVGALSVLDTQLFEDASVWSEFGAGYGYLPAILPVLGLVWLWRRGS